MEIKSNIIERKSINTILSNISFNKTYYNLYNNIITRTIYVDDNVMIFLICQTAFQVGFDGYFDDFYVDVSRRRDIYVKQILSNFRTAYLSSERLSSKIYRFICCFKMSNREITFNRIIRTFDFNNYIANIFIEGNEELKHNFINVCNVIFSQIKRTISRRIAPIDC